MNRKRIAFISMAHIQDIGVLEGKKSLFEDILVFFNNNNNNKLYYQIEKGKKVKLYNIIY